MNYMWETFKMAFYLIFVIAFILAIYYLIKKRFNFSSSRELKLIDRMSLLNGENVYLVKVYDEVVMLGGTKEELNFLRSWPISELEVDLSDLGEEAERKIDFKNKLAEIIAQDRNDGKVNTKSDSGSGQNE